MVTIALVIGRQLVPRERTEDKAFVRSSASICNNVSSDFWTPLLFGRSSLWQRHQPIDENAVVMIPMFCRRRLRSVISVDRRVMNRRWTTANDQPAAPAGLMASCFSPWSYFVLPSRVVDVAVNVSSYGLIVMSHVYIDYIEGRSDFSNACYTLVRGRINCAIANAGHTTMLRRLLRLKWISDDV